FPPPLQSSAAPPDLPSFPTRRSSDLAASSVLFPEPFGPSTATTSPGAASSVTSLATTTPRAARSLRARTRRTGSVTAGRRARRRSEEHTSELQSLTNLVCRLLLEKKK